MIALGNKVRLRACRDSGAPGIVIKAEREKLVVYWHDLDYWSKHRPDSLELAEPNPRPHEQPTTEANTQ